MPFVTGITASARSDKKNFDQTMFTMPNLYAYYPMNDKDTLISGSFDVLVLTKPELYAYYAMREKNTSPGAASVDGIVLAKPELYAYYPMKQKDSSAGASFDAVAASVASIFGYWPMDEIGEG